MSDSISRQIHRRDLVSASLGMGPALAMGSLYAYIAVNRLGASLTWAGVINAAIFTGFLWNAFFSSITSRVDLRTSVGGLLLVSGLLLGAAGFQTTAVGYGVIVVLLLFCTGLNYAQYDTLLVHLYPRAERPRRLSTRWLVISVSGALLGPALGRLGETSAGFWPAFVTAGMLVAIAGVVFMTIPGTRGHRMGAFRVQDLLDLFRSDQRFRRLVIIIVVYGWFGAGLRTMQVALYQRYGLGEFMVGVIAAVTTGGSVLTSLLITPRMRFRGGLTSFRLCFTAAAGCALLLLMASVLEQRGLGLACITAANLIFGASVTGFTIANQISAANLASDGNVALYVNGFKFFQGLRGLVFPVLVAWAIRGMSLTATMAVSLAVTVFCAVVAWIPRAEGR